MKHQLIAIFILFLVSPVSSTFSCSCLSFPQTFCSLASSEHTLLTGEVLRHYGKLGVSDSVMYTFMDVSVGEKINGKDIQNIITIIGKNGTSCGIDLTPYEVGGSWLFKLRVKSNENVNIDLGYSLYQMSPCNINTLPIKDGNIIGLIAPDMEQVSIKDFIDNLDQCFLIVDRSKTSEGITFRVQPTLVEQFIEIKKGISHFGVENQATQLRIVSLSGQLIKVLEMPESETDFEIDTSYYQRGIYFLVFITGKSVVTQKVIKL